MTKAFNKDVLPLWVEEKWENSFKGGKWDSKLGKLIDELKFLRYSYRGFTVEAIKECDDEIMELEDKIKVAQERKKGFRSYAKNVVKKELKEARKAVRNYELNNKT